MIGKLLIATVLMWGALGLYGASQGWFAPVHHWSDKGASR